jgi:hypothetical protein
MRHAASLIAQLEGLSRPAYHIGWELTQNSRSGLTVRFLSKKLDLPQEEVEYLVDINDRLFYFDISKVKLVAGGANAVKRVADGLENLGDVPALFRQVKGMDATDFRAFEELLGIDKPGGKAAAAEVLLEQHYRHPDSIVEFVAAREFSEAAKEVFDLVWQAEEGVVPAAILRRMYSGSEYEMEQALHDLVRAGALFEMFRFDAEDRLLRVVGLLSELRQYRETGAGAGGAMKLKPLRGDPERTASMGLEFSGRVCRLVAALAAKPARLRGDGELYREDRRRLQDIAPEAEDPSLSTLLWAAEGVGWLARVDNELRAANMGRLVPLPPAERHRALFEWLMTRGGHREPRRIVADTVTSLKQSAWYPALDYIRYALHHGAENEQPVLKNAGGHWRYASLAASPGFERDLARLLEETFFWTGVVERADTPDGTAFRFTPLGRWLLLGDEAAAADRAAVDAARSDGESEFLVQPNFDVVVPTQEVDPLLTVPLDQFAERVSTGQVTVYRLDKDQFTRAVQSGHDGEAFVEFLMAHNRGGALPENVMSTLEAWRGGMKRVRLRTIHVVEAEDPLVMADFTHRKRFQKFLTPLDPALQVGYHQVSKANLVKELEKEGFIVD